MEKNNEILHDVNNTLTWLEKRNSEIQKGNTGVVEEEMPILARVICGGEKELNNLVDGDRKRYKRFFKDNKNVAAALTLTGLGTSGIGIGAIASGIGAVGTITTLGTGIGGATLGLTAAGLGAATFIPALWPIGIGMLAFSMGRLIKKSKSKEGEAISQKAEKVYEDSQVGAKECYNKLEENNKKIAIIFSQKLNGICENLADVSKKISIKIDDAIHSDNNKRLMQYQEIVLKQYKSQKEIADMFEELKDAYNKLVVENEELVKKIAAYEANMKIVGCANNYIS